MKGSHRVDEFLDWIEKHPTMPVWTKVTFARKIRNAADRASMTGKQGLVQFRRQNEVVMAVRVFEDGSCEFGYPVNLKWKAEKYIPPPRKLI